MKNRDYRRRCRFVIRLIALVGAAWAVFTSGCNAESPNGGTPDGSTELRLVEVALYYTDSRGEDHRFTLSEKELGAFHKLCPAMPNCRDDQGIKCADAAVGLTMTYSDGAAIHAHFCGNTTQLHVFRPGHTGEMLTVPNGLYALLLDAARAHGWQLDTLGNW